MRVSAVLLALLVLVSADRAAAASIQIGAVDEIRAGALPSATSAGGFAVQVGEAAGTYAVPAGYGTITAWSHSAGTAGGSLTFKVYRPTGAKQEFLVVGSDTRTVMANAVQTFPVQIPVRPGDRIGLSSPDDDSVQLAYESGDTADKIGFFDADPPPGTTDTTDGNPFEEFKLDVAATVDTGTSPGGGPPVGGGGSTDYTVPPTRPAVSRLRIVPGAFPAARRGPSAGMVKRGKVGTTVSYRANVSAAVQFTVQRLRPGRRSGGRCVAATQRNRRRAKCTRTVRLKGGFSQSAVSGSNRFRFSGRVGGRRLRPGRYRLVATPRTNTQTGKPAGRAFRIVR